MTFPLRSNLPLFSLIFLFLALAASASSAEQGSRPTQAPQPKWASFSSETDFAAEGRSPVIAGSTGVDYLNYEQVCHVSESARTTFVAYRITAQNGLSNGAQIAVQYDPAYEALEFHHLRVWRDGIVQDRLSLPDIQVIQQERDLERQMFNGLLTALAVLPDIRIGDIVEYAYTLRGANPVFAGKFIHSTGTSWASPVRFEQVRVLTQGEPAIEARAHGKAQPRASVRVRPDGLTEQTWTLRDVPAVISDPDTPAWFTPFSFLEFSEYVTWRNVQAWGIPLYEVTPGESALRSRAAQLTANARTAEQKILAILDFVQREIRYLGIELGANSHRPHPPTQVLQRRFGDCKDKVLLFRALLAEVGLTAHPVLVHSYHGEHIADRVPGPYAFNHVIALVELDGERYWVDPTHSYQRGPLRERCAAEKSLGLVLAPGVPARLEPISARPEAIGRREVAQRFTYEAVDQPAKMSLIYRYIGGAATGARAYIENNTPEEITRHLLNLYKRGHPELTATAPLRITDDTTRNIVELALECAVPGLWEADPKKSTRHTASFYPWAMHNDVIQPEHLSRDAPLGLDHPQHRKVTIEIDLKGVWQLDDFRDEITTDWYNFTAIGRHTAPRYTLEYTWQSRTDHVPIEALRAHLARLEDIRKVIGYTIAYDTAPAVQITGLNWRAVAISFLICGSILWFGIHTYRRPLAEPPPVEVRSQLVGINGWLILPALGLCVRPLWTLSTLIENGETYFTERMWQAVTDPTLSSYRPGLGALVLGELAVNLALGVFTVVLAVFFFKRKRQTPALYMALLIATPILLLVHQSWLSAVSPDIGSDADTWKGIVQGVIGAVVWVPYFASSRRVRATFTR